ncbi:MAG TPA: acyl-CoA dehydrogenase family protein, partial [Acidimicrobiales bacterium]|nr:acyl-CoA dehydrogenase family protein [Acidimicrobiales bacterium]
EHPAAEHPVSGHLVEAPLVPHAQESDLVLLVVGDEARLLRRDEVSVEPLSTVDAARRCGRVSALGSGTLLDVDAAAIGTAAARATLATAAALVGLSARMLHLTTRYVCERRQFGVPVGSFQAVKHQLADALVAVEFARPVVLRAAWSLARQEAGADCHLSMAKAMASEAATGVARAAIQCHGAMGYTVEYDLHLFVKRAWALAADWGSASEHVGHVARALWA